MDGYAMKYIVSFLSALGMFTAIPMPQYEWDMEHGSRMTACFGLVGAVLGTLSLFFAWIFSLLPIPVPVFSVLTIAAAYFLTGFLHLDGFMDVCDALLSHRDEEGRRQILKDSHCGSFSVVCLLFVLAGNFASIYALRTLPVSAAVWAAVFISIPVLSRCTAGLLLLGVKTMPGSTLGAFFKTGNGPAVKTVLIVTGISALAVVAGCAGIRYAITLAAGTLPGALLGLYAARRLGGVNGDVSGFTVVLCETLMLLALTFQF